MESEVLRKRDEREELEMSETTEEREDRMESEAQRKRDEREQLAISETTQEREDRMESEVQRKRDERAVIKPQGEFPPKVSEDVLTESVSNFIKATSSSTLKHVVCGVCGGRCKEFEVYDIAEIPCRDLLLQESSTEAGFSNLPEYEVEDLLLHSKGVSGDQVTCCTKCLSSLKKMNSQPLVSPTICRLENPLLN